MEWGVELQYGVRLFLLYVLHVLHVLTFLLLSIPLYHVLQSEVQVMQQHARNICRGFPLGSQWTPWKNDAKEGRKNESGNENVPNINAGAGAVHVVKSVTHAASHIPATQTQTQTKGQGQGQKQYRLTIYERNHNRHFMALGAMLQRLKAHLGNRYVQRLGQGQGGGRWEVSTVGVGVGVGVCGCVLNGLYVPSFCPL